MGLSLFEESAPFIYTAVMAAAFTPGEALGISIAVANVRIDAIYIRSTDSVDRTVRLSLTANSQEAFILTATVPANAGNLPGVAPVDLIALLAPAAGAIVLSTQQQCTVYVIDAMTVGSQLDLAAVGGYV